jgi:hypothetical protein
MPVLQVCVGGFFHINFNEIYSFVDGYFITVLVLLQNVHGKGHSDLEK